VIPSGWRPHASLAFTAVTLACAMALPSSAAAEPCPPPDSPGNSAWLFIDGRSPSRHVGFPNLRVKARVGQVISVDNPVEACGAPGFWTYEDASLAVLDSRGRPTLGRGIDFAGASGVSAPALRGAGLLWPRTILYDGSWEHRVARLRIAKPGRYYLVAGNSQLGTGNSPAPGPPVEPQRDPVAGLDRRNPYAVGISTGPAPRVCGSVKLAGGRLRLGAAGAGKRHPGRFRGRAAFGIRRKKLDCLDVSRVMGAMLGARDELTALGAAGYRATRVARSRIRGRRAYRVFARRGRLRLSYQRFGQVRIDHSIYRAGQHIDVFARIEQDPPPSTWWSPCTASFVVSVPGQSAPVGLTAAHCLDGVAPFVLPVRRGFAETGGAIDLGVAITPPGEYPGGLDAGVFSILPEWGVAQQIERGEKAPLTVLARVPSSDQPRGTRVCFAGRSSGADQCGRVVGREHKKGRDVTCTDIDGAKGDSGGPVYLDPGVGLQTSAAGVVTLIRRKGILGSKKMCYTQIGPVLDALGAALPPGPMVREPVR
jgi:hypothetical protein